LRGGAGGGGVGGKGGGGGRGGEINQALYAHMNNKRKMKKKKSSIFNILKEIRQGSSSTKQSYNAIKMEHNIRKTLGN
jgi:hypothetical protein